MTMQSGHRARSTVRVLRLGLLACALGLHGQSAGSGEAIASQGERMYREGIAPSGEPLRALVKGSAPVPGTAFTCVSCHQRAGFGGRLEGVSIPPVTGPRLFAPRFVSSPELSPEERQEFHLASDLRRPAYTEASLARVLRTGLDPAGRELLDTMPRYALTDPEAQALIAFLKTLSARPDPGVTERELRLATVFTEDVSEADRAALLAPLERFIDFHTPAGAGRGSRLLLRSGTQTSTQAYRKLVLAKWVLKGAPGSWRKQLEDHLRREPVFALVGGIASGSWQPIHDFSEAHRLPCLLPLTDLPVVSDQDWYTLYFAKGYVQEGEAAARFLAERLELSADAGILQVVQDTAEGRALAEGFDAQWSGLGRRPVRTLRLGRRTPLPKAFLLQRLKEGNPPAILLWTGADAFPALDALGRTEGAVRDVVLSARLLQEAWGKVPEAARGFAHFTYPYRFPRQDGSYRQFAPEWTTGVHTGSRIPGQAATLVRVLNQALKDMDRHFHRDHLLDVIGLQMDQPAPDYERLSFGPGLRYASKGCHLVQVAAGDPPRLLLSGGGRSH